MPPAWLVTVSWVYLGVCAAIGVYFLVDIYVLGYRQRMSVMHAVWPVTALYMGPLALWLYLRYGRSYSPKYQAEKGLDGPAAPQWVRVGVSVMHCGAGCTVGDIIAETLIFVFALTLLGHTLFAAYVGDYILAFAFGIVFQYAAITQMGDAGFKEAITRTFKADTLSLTAFEVGLFVWMGLTYFVLFTSPHLNPASPVFWFMMQIGMILGFLTSYPANVWLIHRGVKEAM